VVVQKCTILAGAKRASLVQSFQHALTAVEYLVATFHPKHSVTCHHFFQSDQDPKVWVMITGEHIPLLLSITIRCACERVDPPINSCQKDVLVLVAEH
jgi:hypothetical protein